MRIRVLAAAAALTIAFAACGGGDGHDSTPTTVPQAAPTATPVVDDGTREPDETRAPDGPLVSAANALGPAAERFAEAQSLKATFAATATFGFQDRSFSGELLYRAPDASLLSASFFGRPIEMLAYLPNYYVNTPAEGWKAADLPSLTVNLDQLSGVIEKHGFFNLQSLVASLDQVEQLPDAKNGDTPYARYRADVTLSEIGDQLPGGIADQETLAEAEQFIEGMWFDFWIARDTGLPRRVLFVVNAIGESDDGGGGLEMSVDYTEFSGAVEIPAEPVDAPPFSIEDLG